MPKNEGPEVLVTRLRDFLNGGVPTREEFMQLAEELVKYVTGVDKRLSGEFESLAAALRQMSETLKGDSDASLSEMKEGLNSLFVGERLSDMERLIRASVREELDKKIGEVDERLRRVRDGLDGEKGEKGDPGSPDTPEQVRDKLESLKDEERLDPSAIKGLDKYIQENSKAMGVPYAGPSGGGIVKAYDLSSQLDGADRTFSLPAFWRVISVHLSSFPSILRPTVDYTTNAATMEITFTSEVPANALAAGQTLIVVYAEA